MTKGIELLAPSGDWEAFLAAVENGADAVYLGGKLFNARQFAGNFDIEELEKVLNYAHVRDVKIYLTMNTLISDDELEEAVDFAGKAYLKGIDGIIVQDMGFAGILRNLFPDLHLHASTQMTIYSLEGIRVLEKLGFKRGVLARELSIKEISHIAKNSSLEIEVFIHGALCISYSGQCLMSSIIGGRSGNRGKCAQPCRLPFDLLAYGESGDMEKRRLIPTEGKYLLSPKDLYSIYELKKIIESGVKSLKIEGRMKSPEYVATVVRTYRKYLDLILEQQQNISGREINVDREDMRNLTQIFNRGGFTSGYLAGKAGREMMSYEKPKNWGIHIGNVEQFNRKTRTVKIRLNDRLSVGDGIEIWNKEKESPGTVVSIISKGKSNVKTAGAGDVVEAGYLTGKITRGNPVYKTSDKELNAEARRSFSQGNNKKTGLACEITVKRNIPVVLKVRDNRGNETESSGLIPEEAVNVPVREEKIIEQLSKTGSTPFRFDEIKVELDQGLSLPLSEINRIRRSCLEKMEIIRSDIYRRHISREIVERKKSLIYFPGNSRKREENLSRKLNPPGLSAFFYKWENGISYENFNVDRFYFPVSSLLDASIEKRLKLIHEKKGCEVFLWLPSITRGNIDKLIRKNIDRFDHEIINGVLVGNIGSLEYLKNIPGLKKTADYSFNIFNSAALEEVHKLELDGATLSPEMTLRHINNLTTIQDMHLELIVYGRIPLMTIENCIPGNAAECMKENGKPGGGCRKSNYCLRDRKGVEFPVLCDKIDCRSRILNSNVMFIPDELEKVEETDINMLRLHFLEEDSTDMEIIVNMHRCILKEGYSVAGKYGKIIDSIKSKGYNRGHLFRGV